MEVWPGWNLTTKNGVTVLVTPAGKIYSKEDIDPNPDQFNQTELARAMGVSTAAIRDRISRRTLPEYDGFTSAGRGYWMADTIKHLVGGRHAE